MSPSAVHASVKRAVASGLLSANNLEPRLEAIEEFLIHGLRYAFPAKRGALTRGMPTAANAEPLSSLLAASDGPPVVWPDPNGEARGEGLKPLYPGAVTAARRDPKLYALLAISDALRSGSARERSVAAEALKRELRVG